MYKNSILKCIIALFIFSSIQAQTFSWGNRSNSLRDKNAKIDYLIDKKIYQIHSVYNSEIFNQDVNISSYDANSLNFEKTEYFGVGQPVMGKAMMSHLEKFHLEKTNYVFFLDEYNSKTKERELFVQRVNIETGQKTEPMLVASMPTRNSTYFISQSPNKQFYAIIKQHSHDKKANEKVNVALLDKEFKTIKEIAFETPYLNKSIEENSLYVSDMGTVFVIKNIDLAKEKPFKTLFFWDGNSASMTETSLKFNNDFQLYSHKGHFDNDKFYLHGLYTRIGSKGVQIYGGGLPAAGIYAASFSLNGNVNYIVQNETGEITGLNMKDFVFEGIKTWFFGDKLFINKKARPMTPGKDYSVQYDYTYTNSGFVFGRLDNETGKLEWHKIVPTSEKNTVNDDGVFLSYLYFLKNHQLYILFNDTQKTKTEGKIVDDRFINMQTYDDRGNQIESTTLADTGLEIRYDASIRSFEENFDLDTSVNVIIEEGKYIVRSRSTSGEKHGYFTIK